MVLQIAYSSFRNPFRKCALRGRVEAEIGRVVRHEIAHHFGLDEEELRRIEARAAGRSTEPSECRDARKPCGQVLDLARILSVSQLTPTPQLPRLRVSLRSFLLGVRVETSSTPSSFSVLISSGDIFSTSRISLLCVGPESRGRLVEV